MSKKAEEFEGYIPDVQICVQCKNYSGKHILSDRIGFCSILKEYIPACKLEWAYILEGLMCVDFKPRGLSVKELKQLLKQLEAKLK